MRANKVSRAGLAALRHFSVADDAGVGTQVVAGDPSNSNLDTRLFPGMLSLMPDGGPVLSDADKERFPTGSWPAP